MKLLNMLIILMMLLILSCTHETGLTQNEKKAVETEIHAFMSSVEAVANSSSPDKYFDCFLHTDELAFATQGQLLTNPTSLHDTISKHLAFVEKQSIKTNAEKIFIINKEAVVLSVGKATTITFKNGSQITMPYAWTLLIVKRDGKWKIAQLHN